VPFEEPSDSPDLGFAEYKQAHEGVYSPERLEHYFNTEMGIASNLLFTLSARIKSGNDKEGLSSEIDALFVTIGEHLVTSHEIGNLMADLLQRPEQRP